MDRTHRHPTCVPHPRAGRDRGQALVEFSIAVVPFLLILMAIVDLGRGVYQMNGTAEAAREIARVTSLHPEGAHLGASTKVQDVIGAQRALVPAFTLDEVGDITCVDVTDTPKPDDKCTFGDYVRVHVASPFTPATPMVMLFGSHTFESVARAQIP
ncbi:MAG: TadE/TadG family type IV pilus assembly protein [Candidatus Limnocylindrales bacterium]